MTEQQQVIVITENWDAVEGKLYRFEGGRQVGAPYDVALGKSGMAWGIGLHFEENLPGPAKREGDGRAPAGIYSLGPVFGYGPENPLSGLKMPYLPIDDALVCVDDPASLFYNWVVRKGPESDWKSAEEMTHPLYRFGLVVGHNTDNPQPYCGSCIFMHIWRAPGHGTAGCTALAEDQLKELILWLDPAKNPILIQLPLTIYPHLQKKWNLPNL